MKARCDWAGDDTDYIAYHDKEWGVPVRDDRVLFEFLILEGAQAGLSWITILKRRSGYKNAFADFDPRKVAQFDEDTIQILLQDKGIIRNRLKVRSAVKNAQVFLQIQEEFGSFSTYLWAFVDDKPIKNKFQKMSDVPASTELSNQISKDLKKRGMSFVGSTIIYAYLQSMGLVDDHVADCFRYSV